MVKLNPNETFTAQPGSLVMMSDCITADTDIGNWKQGCTRLCCAGESLFRLILRNNTSTSLFLSIAPVGPGTIIPIDLRRYSGLTFSSGSFLAAYGTDWEMKVRAVKNVGTLCFGGQGIFLNQLYGNSMAFLTGIGTIEQVTLERNEKIIVDQSNLLAFEKTVDFDVRSFGCSMVCCCGGFGLFQSVLTGPGLVLVHSLPLQKMRKALKVSGDNGGHNGSQ